MKKLRFLIPLIFVLGLLAVPTLVFAHQQAISSTVFYACEATDGSVDAATITQEDTLTCPVVSDSVYVNKVQWSVTGPAGQDGTNGTNGTNGQDGAPGPVGPAGPAGIPFSHAACTEKLTGSAQQENMVFCQSDIEADSGFVYSAAIKAAQLHIIVGTPIAASPSVDWGGTAITYVEFTSGFHMEYHSDNVVRIYNTLNQRVF